MPSFVVVLDGIGAEVAQANCNTKEMIVMRGWKAHRYRPVSITPVSMDAAASGTVKGAAWGFVLAGPFGAAVGAMIGGGPKVAFEVVTTEGETFRCLAGKSAYLTIKRQLDKAIRRVEKAGPAAAGGGGATKSGRWIWWLAGGLVGVPVLVGALGSNVSSSTDVASSTAPASEAALQSASQSTEASGAGTHRKPAPILDGAVMAYRPAKYPRTTAAWGAAGLARINKLMADAAESVSRDQRCEAVESVDLSDVRSVPPTTPIVFVDCTNNRRFYVGEDNLGRLAPPELRLP